MVIKHINSQKSDAKSNEPDSLRDEHNRDLIRRMRNGEPLTSFDSHSSWFPPRPIIAKDEGIIRQLYREEEKLESQKSEVTKVASPKVLQIVKN